MMKFLHNILLIDIVKYAIAAFHIVLCLHSWISLGSFVNFSDLTTFTPIIISIYTALFLLTLQNKRWTYYTYIGFALLNIMVVLIDRNPETLSLQKAFFPFNLFFAGVLILDLKRIILLAYRSRSAE
jgi:hypothetical protein